MRCFLEARPAEPLRRSPIPTSARLVRCSRACGTLFVMEATIRDVRLLPSVGASERRGSSRFPQSVPPRVSAEVSKRAELYGELLDAVFFLAPRSSSRPCGSQCSTDSIRRSAPCAVCMLLRPRLRCRARLRKRRGYGGLERDQQCAGSWHRLCEYETMSTSGAPRMGRHQRRRTNT